jgi:hypothetical protein
VQIPECSFGNCVGLPPALIVAAHHEHRRRHTEVANALEQVEALSPEQGVACSRQDHVQQHEVEALTVQNGKRIRNRTRRRDLISVLVLEPGEDFPQYVDHVRLVINDQNSLRCLRVDRNLPFGLRGSKVSRGQLSPSA